MGIEKIYLEGAGVKVTSARFVNYGTTYPIRGITSISTSTNERKPFFGIMTIGLTGLIGLSLFSVGIARIFPQFSAIISVSGLILFGVACFMAWGRESTYLYLVIFRTAGGDGDSFFTTDKAFRDAVFEALNNAVSHRVSCCQFSTTP